MQLGSFLWFYEQVKSGAVWDIKLQNRWNAALPGVPFLKNNDGFLDFELKREIENVIKSVEFLTEDVKKYYGKFMHYTCENQRILPDKPEYALLYVFLLKHL